jgi:cardiolipin synthase A/B
MASRSVLVLPDDSPKAIVEAISGAQDSLRIKMFVFDDAEMLAAVIAAKRHGIDVRVMLNPARRNGEDDNAATRAALTAAGVAVNDSSPAFDLTHEKSMVVDEAVAFIKSLNWTSKDLTETRDYAIVTDHVKEVREVAGCFDADWSRQAFVPPEGSHLIWCPDIGRARICRFIDAAQQTLFVQNERYQDTVVIERLVRAARRGVAVHAMVPAPHTLKLDKLVEGVGGLRILADVGVKVHRLRHLKLHGKMFLADGKAAIVGSINLAPGSLDGRRELAIEVHDDIVIDRLQQIAHHDWKNSAPLDLTDAGLLADIHDRTQAANLLVLKEK